MRKLGSLTPIYNNEPFIIPHFKMLESYGIDRNVVLLGSRPFPQYHVEHGYSLKPDKSEELLKKRFPKVEIFPSNYSGEFGASLYNQAFPFMRDCDIVLIFDVDMLFTPPDWKKMIDFIRNTDHDCYRMNYCDNSINYYMDFDHGLKDAKEFDPRAINPKYDFEQVLEYPHGKQYVMEWESWVCHHFRGWCKPKSVTKNWPESDYARQAFRDYSNNGDWFHCPTEIRNMFDKKTTNRWLNRFL